MSSQQSSTSTLTTAPSQAQINPSSSGNATAASQVATGAPPATASASATAPTVAAVAAPSQGVKDEALQKPSLYTTLTDTPAAYCGARGECQYKDCACRFFIGDAGLCTACSHSNLHHQTAPSRQHLQQRADEQLAQQRRYRNVNRERILAERSAAAASQALAEQREREQSASAQAQAALASNTHPCSVEECDCKKFEQPAKQDQQQQPPQTASSPTPSTQSQQQPPVISITSPSNAALHNEASILSLHPQNASLVPVQQLGNLSLSSSVDNSSATPLIDAFSLTGAATPAIDGSHTPMSGLILSHQPANATKSLPAPAPMPQLCRRCSHASMYHCKSVKEKSSASKSANAKEKAAAAAAAAAKKGGKGKKK